jgi:hypothetical protein
MIAATILQTFKRYDRRYESAYSLDGGRRMSTSIPNGWSDSALLDRNPRIISNLVLDILLYCRRMVWWICVALSVPYFKLVIHRLNYASTRCGGLRLLLPRGRIGSCGWCVVGLEAVTDRHRACFILSNNSFLLHLLFLRSFKWCCNLGQNFGNAFRHYWDLHLAKRQLISDHKLFTWHNFLHQITNSMVNFGTTEFVVFMLIDRCIRCAIPQIKHLGERSKIITIWLQLAIKRALSG